MNSKQVKHLLQQKTKTLFTIAPDMLVFDAIQLMVDNNLGSLLVVKVGRLGDNLILCLPVYLVSEG